MDKQGDLPRQPMSFLIADDQKFFRQWLERELQAEFPSCTVHQADSLREAIARTRSCKPDVIFMDIRFGGARAGSGAIEVDTRDGVDAAGEIWKENPATAIVVVSNFDEPLYVRKLYEVTPDEGVYGYLLKDNVADHLVVAVQAVLSGDCWIDPKVRRGWTRLERGQSPLTDELQEVLMGICLGLSDRAISKVLWIGMRAVAARLRKLYRAFGIPSRNDPASSLLTPRCRAIRHALKLGLINVQALDAWETELRQRAEIHGQREIAAVLAPAAELLHS